MAYARTAAKLRDSRGNRRLPGPKGLPIIGVVLDFASDQLGFVTDTARKYGDIAAMNFAGWPTLLLNEMDAIEKVLVKEHGSFMKSRLIFRHVTALFGEGILTSNGKLWQRQRRLASPPFAGRQLPAYDEDMVRLTRRMLDGWQAGQIIDIHPEMMGLTLRIAAKTLFESDVEQDVVDMDRALGDLIIEVERRFKRPVRIPDWVPLPGHVRYRRAIRTVERVVSRMIRDRRSTGVDDRTDFLSRMMAARDENGAPLPDRLLRDEAVTLLLAGHETTALALSWTWLLLGQHPEIDARLADEIGAALGNRQVTSEDLPSLRFTESVVMEAMRLYPPAWAISRESTAPFQLGGYDFPAGTTIFICPWVLHRDPRHFEEPDAFRPERWMGNLARELPRFAYMPFGGGPRVCIGQRFALNEAMIVLATMAQRFSAEWQSDHKVTPFPSITLRPKGGVWLKLRTRSGGVSA